MRSELASLPDAEVAENHVEDILNVHAPGQPPERARREPELLCEDIFAASFGEVRCPWPEDRTEQLREHYASKGF